MWQHTFRFGRSFYIVCGVSLCIGLLFAGPVFGAISTTGNVTPDPTTTTSGVSLYVGDTADGTMTVDGGSDVDSAHGFIGDDAGVTGTATVTGGGSTWTSSGSIIVGSEGTGTLNIEDGGAVSNVKGFLGGNSSSSTGTATVTGSGSTWTNSVHLHVGLAGTGTLNIEDGGAVSNVSGFISSNSGSTGTATVTGAGSTWTNSGDFYVGFNESGTLNIENGGAVTVGGDLSIHSLSTLGISLASTSDPLLDVAGNASLNGLLDVSLVDGFLLQNGDIFTVIDLTDIGASVSGTFIGLSEGDSVGNFGAFDLYISYVGGDGNDVTLTSIPEPGTLALLGCVGLLVWRRRRGA